MELPMYTRVRPSTLLLLIIGIVLVIASVLVRFVALPIGSRLPAGLSVHLVYSGTSTALNPKALQAGDLAHALVQNAPAQITRDIRVVSTHGNTAVVHDDTTLTIAGLLSLPDDHVYSVNRTTLAGAAGVPAGVSAEPARGGITIAWPVGPKPDNSYRGYDSATRTVVPIAYHGRGSQSGVSTYLYGYTATGPLADPVVLAGLPKGLPRSVVGSLGVLLPASTRARLAPLAATLPDPIPLSYSARTVITGQVDRRTGLPVNESEQQTITAELALPGHTVELLPVLSVDATLTPASVNTAVHNAKSAGRLLTLVGVVAPLVLGLVGVSLIAITLLVRRPHRRPTEVTAVAHTVGALP
jgi:hypothetical protein